MKHEVLSLSRKLAKFFCLVLILLQVFYGFAPVAFADTNTWDFSASSDYTFDNTKIEFSSGQAQLKATSTPAWYSTSWTKRKAVTVTGSSAGAQTNYQIKVTVAYDSDMQADFDDVRFTSSDGTTLIDHWLESKTDSNTADFWVEVPSIPASPSTVFVYMYYGNSGASSASSGASTFISGTDFTQDDSFTLRENGTNESYGNQTGNVRSGTFTNGIGENWIPHLLLTGGRLDSVEYLGNGVVLVGGRTPNPGHVYKSTDYGLTWTDKGAITGTDDITTIKSAGNGTAYLLTGDSYLYKTTDYGDNWSGLGQVSTNTAYSSFELSYGLLVTDAGSILVSDTNATGGHIFRSTNGGVSFTDLGVISSKSLYRFDKIGDGIIINGWDGRVFKSTTDGATWVDKGQLANSPLYATEYLGSGIVLQANEAGNVFRSTDNAETWTDLGDLGDGADDFAYLGNGVVVYSTYTGSMNRYRSVDSGQTWSNIGTVPTGVAGDSLEHVIYLNDGSNQYGLGVTNKGYFLRSQASTPGVSLKKVNLDRVSDSYVRKQLSSSISNNFAVRIKVNPISVGDGIAWLPIAAISTTGERACSTNDNYALAIIQRGSLGIGLVEFKGTDQSPCYSTLTELGTSLNTSYTIEIRKTSATSASVYIYNADGTLFGNNSLTISNQNYNYLMAHIAVPAGWSAATSQQNISYIFLRNYVSPEPTYSIGSEVNLYPTDNPTVQPTTTQIFTSLSAFTETATKNSGEINYQISNDGGTTWYWYNSGWTTTVSGYTEASTASQINSNIATFPVGSGSFLFKAYLHSDGSQLVQLDNIDLTYINDSTGPTGTISNGNGSPTNDTTPTFNLTIADAGVGITGAQMQFSCDNSTWSTWESYATPKTDFNIRTGAGCTDVDGSKTIYVKYKDSLGNIGSSYNTGAFTLDTASSIATLSNTPTSLTTSTSASITIAGTDITTYKYKLDSGAYGAETPIATLITLSSLSDASHTLSVIGKDSAGNWQAEGSATTYTWTVDTTAPVVTFSIPATSDSLTITFTSFSATDANTITGYLVNESATTPAIDDTGWSGTAQTQYVFTTEGAKTLYAWAKDEAGNISTSGNGLVTITLPTPAPTPTVSHGGGGFSAPYPTAPAGGFTATRDITNSQNKTVLHFGFGNDITNIAISDNINFTPATYINAASSVEWTATTTKILYIKYCNRYGRCSNPISLQINAFVPAPLPVTIIEEHTVPREIPAVVKNNSKKAPDNSKNSSNTNEESSKAPNEEPPTPLTSKVEVIIVDTNQEPVEGATVTLHSTPRTTTTDKDGKAIFENVEPGPHRIVVSYRGQEGEQAINLDESTAEFQFKIQIEAKNPLVARKTLVVLGILALVIAFLAFLLLKKYKRVNY